MRENQGSSFSRSVSGFAGAISAICTFLLIPLIMRHLRPLIYDYLRSEFPHDWSLWGSWGFVVLLVLGAYFGISALFQMIVQWLFHRSIRKGGF